MSQISPPMRIVLGVAVAFLAVYMIALRPKSESAPPPAPTPAPAGNVATGTPAVTGAGKAVEAAKGAVAATEAQQKKEGQDAGVVPSTGDATATHSSSSAATKSQAPGVPPVPAADLAGLPRPVARAIRRHEVLALLFTNRRSPDDRAVQKALKTAGTSFAPDAVFARSVPLKKIARYGRITRGADVQQSPTVVVVDRKLHASTLVGYVDALSVRQSIVDAMRASGGLFPTDRYLARVNNTCSAAAHDIWRKPQALTPAQAPRALRSRLHRFDAFVADLRATPAPARWRALKHQLVRQSAAEQRTLRGAVHGLGRHPSAADVASVIAALQPAQRSQGSRFDRTVDRHHLIYCGRLG